MEVVDLSDIDIFYISYDEPNKEANWSENRERIPWIERVDGIKGFDSAHKECAKRSNTNRFITIDGDNIIDPDMVDYKVEIPDQYEGSVLSWSGKNSVNGLIYGNGGVKCWTKEFVLNMNTHETASEPDGEVDFCWKSNYVQMDKCFSTTYINGSPYQGWRSGFREGVKLTLMDGVRNSTHITDIWEGNKKRLSIWANVGSDVENGKWAMLGAINGMEQMMDPSFDHKRINDYEWFRDFWKTHVEHLDVDEFLSSEYLKTRILGNISDWFDVNPLNPQQSKFFKSVYENPNRSKFNWEKPK